MNRCPRLLAGLALAVLLPVGLTACGSGLDAETTLEHSVVNGGSGNVGTIALRDVYLVGPATTQTSLYLSLFNNGPQPDQLTAVSTPVASAVLLPGQTGSVTIPAVDGAVALTTPATALTVEGLTSPLTIGETVQVTFTFAKAGTITLPVPVEGPTGSAPTPSPGSSPPLSPL